MSRHRVTFGGIELNGRERVVWPFTRGGGAQLVPLVVSTSVHDEIQSQLVGTTKFYLSFEGPDGDEHRIENIGIVEWQGTQDPSKVLYRLADRRFRVQDEIVDDTFNATIRTNEKTVPGGKVDPNIAQFNAIPIITFAPFSCRRKSVPRGSLAQQFASGLNTDDAEPWTALTALRYLLGDDGFWKGREITDWNGNKFRFGAVDFRGATEKKILLKNWRPQTGWAEAIEYLCRRGRYFVYLDPAGNFFVSDYNPQDSATAFERFGKYRGAGGVPFVARSHTGCPVRLGTRFPSRHEVRLNYNEKRHFPVLAQNISTGGGSFALSIAQLNILRPVVQAPQAVGKIQRGQWVSEPDILDAWSNDGAHQLPNNPGLPGNLWRLQDINRYIMHSSLGHLYQRDFTRPNFQDDILESRVAALYEHHRRYFQLHPDLIGIIEDLDDDSVEVIDPATGRRQPQNVACDYLAWDSLLLHHKKGSGGEGDGSIRNRFIKEPPASPAQFGQTGLLSGVLDNQIESIPWGELKLSPVKITIVDPVLLIFKIDFVKDLSGVTVDYDRFLIEPNTIPSSRYDRRNKKVYSRQMVVSDTWRLAVRLAIRFRANSDSIKFHTIERLARDHGIDKASGPSRVVRYFPGVEAGWEYQDGQKLDLDASQNQVQVTGNRLINPGLLEDIAKAEAEIFYHDYLPRVIGFYAAFGWDDAAPTGQVGSVVRSYDGNNGGLETWIDSRRAPPAPSIWELLNPVHRNIVGKFAEGSQIE